MKLLLNLANLMILLVMFSCSDSITETAINFDQETPIRIDQKLFEVEYINYAWGYSHMGIHIDDTGKLYSYRYEHNIKYEDQWKSNQEGVYSEQKLHEKFEHDKQLVNTINEAELIQMISLISGAIEGNLSKPESKMTDFGIWRYKSYSYDNIAREYTEIILKEDGDWFGENESWQAKAIAAWLEAQKENWLESVK